jgi:hypothetical protein
MHPHLKLRCRKKTHKLQEAIINAKLLHAKGHETHQILYFTRSRCLSLATEFRSPLRFERERRGTTQLATTSGSLGLNRDCVCFTGEISPKSENLKKNRNEVILDGFQSPEVRKEITLKDCQILRDYGSQ